MLCVSAVLLFLCGHSFAVIRWSGALCASARSIYTHIHIYIHTYIPTVLKIKPQKNPTKKKRVCYLTWSSLLLGHGGDGVQNPNNQSSKAAAALHVQPQVPPQHSLPFFSSLFLRCFAFDIYNNMFPKILFFLLHFLIIGSAFSFSIF